MKGGDIRPSSVLFPAVACSAQPQRTYQCLHSKHSFYLSWALSWDQLHPAPLNSFRPQQRVRIGGGRRRMRERERERGTAQRRKEDEDVWRGAKSFCHFWCEHWRSGRRRGVEDRPGHKFSSCEAKWGNTQTKRHKGGEAGTLVGGSRHAQVIAVMPGPIHKHLIDTNVSIITLSAQQMLSLTWPWQTSNQPNQTDQMRLKTSHHRATKRLGFIRFACQTTCCLLYCVERRLCEEISMPSRH